MMDTLKRIDTAVGWVLRILAVLAFLALFVVMAGNVFFRWVPIANIRSFEEVVAFFFAWMVFIAAAEIWRIREHFKINWIEDKLAGTRIGAVIRITLDILALIFLAYVTWYGWKLVQGSRELTPVLKFPKRWMYVAIPSSGVVMLVYTVRDIAVDLIAGLRTFRGEGKPSE